jgi:V/A-type H+-transporting ATPase subunit K
VAERPESAGTVIVLEAIPETLVILGFVVAAMIIIMVE